MISYFRSILPSRLFMLVLLFVAIQLPLVLLGVRPTAPELLHMLVGERLADGHAMYRDIYDNTAPISALVFWLIDLVAGRSFLAYRLVSMALLLLQALLLNSILNRHSVYATKDYLPALLYLVVGSLSFEFNMLTPLLIGNTFLILSLPYIITLNREGYENNRLFVGGFMLGLAAMSYLPLALFLLVGIFAVIFFASNTFRSTMLMLCGFLFPYAVLITYYMYTNTSQEFLELHLLRPWQLNVSFLRPPSDVAKLMAIPGFILLLSLLSAASQPQRLVFQVKFQQLMWVWLAVSMLVIFTRDEITIATFIIILPPVAYFGEFFFTSGRKGWIINSVFLAMLATVLVMRYRLALGINEYLQMDESPLLLAEPLQPTIQNSTVLVLGNDISYYMHNKPLTPYLNWSLAQRHFGNLSDYQAVFELHENFRDEMPQFLVDKVGLMPELTYKLPDIFGRYEATADAGIYRLK
ncbi:hypothetical protein [Pontibacter chinhatensis]|uniref:Dolichyl-phosphate-mannose-protein mannosyltransferase n=1 Tax=Pontibacter chinhatensis TaxID=1436961 RepID=A0A1I2TWC7_9BACT|nr:hypothetical protein [Pontibacter chinhatensis]SFG69205.1 hypothetical protein SAMN05421739_103303 [Pontibacter chinhatensis]